MTLLSAYISPHPPLILKEIGRGEEFKVKDTIDSLEKVADEIAQKEPETIIVITPHGPLFSDGISIMYEKYLSGNFLQFGENTVKFKKNNDVELIDQIVKTLTEKYKISGALIDTESADYFGVTTDLDHGTLVPLYFIDQKYTDYKLISITYGMLSYQDLYKVGMAIKEVIGSMDRKVVMIASGDLSHRLKNSGPYDFNESGPAFDKKILELIVEKKTKELISMDPDFCEEAGECGKRSIDILLGALDGCDYSVEKLSYEGPFGVGYSVVKFDEITANQKSLLLDIEQSRAEYVRKIQSAQSEYVQLARRTIEEYVVKNKRLDFSETEFFAIDELKATRKGVFVSIKDSGGLRGCIGTFLPSMDCLGDEIVQNAISASTRDPRFPEVEAAELNDLVITVDVLDSPEPIMTSDDLDPKIYGVIVSSGYKKGLLLPDLKGINTVEEQLRVAKSKAGIKDEEEYTLQRFRVKRYY